MKKLLAGLAAVLLLPWLALASASSMDPAGAGVLFSSDGGDSFMAEVLSQPRIRLLPASRRDLEVGLVDPRPLAVLVFLAQRHELAGVGPFVSGHDYFVRDPVTRRPTRRPSNHAFGRAADIGAVDGAAVTPSNRSAFDAVREVLSLPDDLRPDEVGAPWALRVGAAASFTDAAHQDHLHLGWNL
ncbi:MAG: hypothetical protein ACREJP_01135 [Candidatus Methylomirabilales bacterium]